MRLFPILIAIIVSAAIYAFVFERDRLTAMVASSYNEIADITPLPGTPVTVSKAVGVIAVHSVARTVDSAVILRGQTEAARQVELRAETTGQIASEPLRKGRLIEQGQLICELSPGIRRATLAEAKARLNEALARVPEAQARGPEAQARLEEARARVTEAEALLSEAEINANAATELFKGGFASETRVASTEAAVRGAEAAVTSAKAGMKSAASGLESMAAGIETASAGVESAHASIAAAEKEIERLTITAPFSGLLENDSAELGSLLQPGDLCATIIQLDTITVVGFVPETEVARVKVGASATVELTSGERIQGKVDFVSRAADPVTRTFRVDTKVPNADLSLRDGQTAEIAITAAGIRAHLLPQSALTLNNTGDLGVRIVTDNDTVKFIAITLLRDTADGVWISDLPDKADVIIIGQEYVTDGVKVAARFDNEALQ